MKRLGVFVFTAILCVSFFGSFFNPEKVSAATLEEYATRGNLLFTNQIAALNEKRTDPSATGTIPTTVVVVDALIGAVNAGSATFSSTLNTGTDAVQLRYERALNTAISTISEKQRSDPQKLRTPYATNVISVFTKQLNDEAIAERRAAGLREAGFSEEDITRDREGTENARATAVTTATKAPKEPVGKCSLFSPSNVGACIDEGFTWLIKNTLLQLGGFLVWLTANMLNFAIQISILDFSKWASSSLYPIWLVIRQIVSLFIIFAGLYLGFMYIIGRTETFGKFFGWLVIFALFVNFSYPFSRALVDVSNIISLNVYSAAVGSNALTTDFSTAATTRGANTAGAQIMNRLGLYGLVGSATEVENKQGDQQKFISGINSVPGALVAVAFVFYAAYIFFTATAIIAVRTAVLVFLTVASPLLLVDSVVPKLGDAAIKMRKMFFEQLAVAPVFMIMLALTLKFMEVFQTGTPDNPGPLGSATAGALTGGADSIKTFFSILMMLIMLHIMLKVTRSLAGEAGQAATNFMGKVGGFGLGMATGGAGVLARGTVGAGAARLRDSAWMDKMKSSSVGRGMYGLTNSLAQSTYDVRNVGAVSSTMSKAGLTGLGGYGMQKGIKQGFDERKKSRTDEVVKFGSAIQDDAARSAYFNKANVGRLVRVDPAATREAERGIQRKREEAVVAYTKARPEDRAAFLDKVGSDYILREKLRIADQYLAPNLKDMEREPDALKKKVDALVKINDSDLVKKMVDEDPFSEIQDSYKKEVEQLENALDTYSKAKEVVVKDAEGVERKMTEHEQKRQELAQKKQEIRKEVETKKKEVFGEYQKRVGAVPERTVDVELPEETYGGTKIDTVRRGGTDFSHLNTGEKPTTRPGGSDFSHLDQNDHPAPAVMKMTTNDHTMSDTEKSDMKTTFDLHKDSFRETVARRTNSKSLHGLRAERQAENQSNQGNPPAATSASTTVQPTTNPSPAGATVSA